MGSIEQREGRGTYKEEAIQFWANPSNDPDDLFASCPPIEALGGGAISYKPLFRSTTPEDSQMSNRGGISGSTVQYSEGCGLEIGIDTFDDSWTPFRLSGTYNLFDMSSFDVASGKCNDDLKVVNPPPWDNNYKTASTKPVFLESPFYSTQCEKKLPGEQPHSTRKLPSVRPPSTCTSVSSMPLSASVLNQHQKDLYSGSEAQYTSSIDFQSQVTGPTLFSDPTSCLNTRRRARLPKILTGCINCKARRIKCDETKPKCNNCLQSARECGFYRDYKRSVEVAIPMYPPPDSSSSSRTSTASIISTPSLSWSASSVAESDELVNTDLNLPHDRQQGHKVVKKMHLRQLRIGCFTCHTSKVKCRCPPHKKESDSTAVPVKLVRSDKRPHVQGFRSRSPSQVADSGNSGSELNSYQIASQQIGNISLSPAHITQYNLTPGHLSQDLIPRNPTKSSFFMDKPRLPQGIRVSSPSHTQDFLSTVFDTEASYNDYSMPSYTWDDRPIIWGSMMPTVHNIENNMAHLKEGPMDDQSNERGHFVHGYHLDQEAQKVNEVLKFDEFSRPSNEPPHLQRQKSTTKSQSWEPTWSASFNSGPPEASRLEPMFLEQESTEPVQLPAFQPCHREISTSLVSPELEAKEEYKESYESSTPFNAYFPPYFPSDSGLESFPIPPNVPKVARSSGGLVLSERSENLTRTGALSGSASPPSVSNDFPSTNKYSYGFDSSRKKVRCRSSKLGSPSETINEAIQGDHSLSPSFDSLCNILLEAAAFLENKILPSAEFHVPQVLSSNVEHSSETLLEASASRDQLQISSTVLPKAKETLTTCQMQDCGPLSSAILDDKMAIETMPSVEGGSSPSRSNTLSYLTEDETDWGEDEVINSVHDLDFSSFSSISQEDCLSQARVKDSLTRPVFSPMKQALIDRIMKEFWIIFNQETVGIQNRSPTNLVVESADNYKCNTDTNCEGGEDSSQNSTSRSSAQATNTRAKSTQSSLGPRKRDDDNDHEQNDGEEQSPKRPRTILNPPRNPEDNSKFACPYRKRDPRKYCIQFWRPCALTPQDTVARVKGHLYRHHRIYPCQRCKARFENQDAVNQHLVQRSGCELRDTEHGDGITTEMYEKLRTKKKAQRDQTEADRWKDIFKLLFPGEMIPSPYFEAVQEEIVLSPDSRELEDYEEYCRRELPRTFRAALEETVHNELQPMEESIRNQLTNIIRDCQDRVFSRYRSSSTTAAVSSPSKSPMLSRSSVVDHSQESLDSISMASNAQSGARIAPPFFQPPPPQAHLRSRLEVSDLQLNSSKAPDGSVPSDSGYSSNESGNTLGIGSSSGIICDSACMSNSQSDVASAKVPATREEATWKMDNEPFDINAGNVVSDSEKNSIFESSINNAFDNNFDNAYENAFDGSFDTSQYASQMMYRNTWDPSMGDLGMENRFSADETL